MMASPRDMTVGEFVRSLKTGERIALLSIVVFLVAVSTCSDSGGSSGLHTDRNVEVMTIGQDAVRQRLKFPSTASFSEHKYGKLNESEYFYTALVRAENGLGNKVPSYWHVVLAFQPGTANVSQIISVTQTQ